MNAFRPASRRDFLKTSSTIAAGTVLSSGLSLSRSAHAAGSDVIKVALVGAGGRGTGAAGQLMGADKNLKIVAVADAFQDKAAGAVDRMKKKYTAQVDVPPERIFSGFDA